MSIMTVIYRAFPAEIDVPHSPKETTTVSAGGAVSLTAPLKIFGDPKLKEPTYDFEFWDANATLIVSPTAAFNAPADNSNFEASAWYFPEGGGGPSGTGVVTYAFSLNQHKIVTGKTPIASVTPGSAWAGGQSTTVSTTSSPNPVAITAANLIGGYGRFSQWLAFGGKASGRTLMVPAKGACLAIAFYSIPQPDPCKPIRTQLDNLNPSDFPTPEAFRKAQQALIAQLLKCERQYGELPE